MFGLRHETAALFIHVEKFCGPNSAVLLHDTIPLDESTQTRVCNTQFYTGDVWKAVLCLKHHRPDLEIFTIATPYTGLTVVAGLDPKSRVLSDRYEEAVARFMALPFSEIEMQKDLSLNILPNDPGVIDPRLLRIRAAPRSPL